MSTLVVAVSENGVIGRDGAMPWRIAEESRLFRRLTWGGTVVVGGKTYRSPGFPLPGRRHIVVGRDGECNLDDNDKVFVIGGAEIYRLFWPKINTVYLSLIHAEYEGDVRLPDEIFSLASKKNPDFSLVERRFYAALPVPFTFHRFRRNG